MVQLARRIRLWHVLTLWLPCRSGKEAREEESSASEASDLDDDAEEESEDPEDDSSDADIPALMELSRKAEVAKSDPSDSDALTTAMDSTE